MLIIVRACNMSTLRISVPVLNQQIRRLSVGTQLLQRTPFGDPKRKYEDRNRVILKQHESKRLKLATPTPGRPLQFEPIPEPKKTRILEKERKLPSLSESASPYQRYSEDEINHLQNFETFYDPKFNPHLHEKRYEVDPREEPFEAIYQDSNSDAAREFTKVRNVGNPELWEYVERLARIKIAPEPPRRKQGDPITRLPSGIVPPPDSPPDLPYFVPRTRNYLLPVYYNLGADAESCNTMIRGISGDLWQLEEELRTHLQSLQKSKRRILSSVFETDGIVAFRGRHIHQIIDWLHLKGF